MKSSAKHQMHKAKTKLNKCWKKCLFQTEKALKKLQQLWYTLTIIV